MAEFFKKFQRSREQKPDQWAEAEGFKLPTDLERSKFPDGLLGDLEQAEKAANKDTIYFWKIAPFALKRIIEKSGPEGYYLAQKLNTLLALARERGWSRYEDIEIEELNRRLAERRTAKKIDAIDEENPQMKYYKKDG